MKFVLKIETANAAFTDEENYDVQGAVADLLRQAAEQVREGNTSGYLRDYNNGQAIGHWEFKGGARRG